MKVLNPTNDFVFKTLMEREQRLLHSMLEAVLGESITELYVVDTQLRGEVAAHKSIVIDVRVVLRGGKRIVVEMQVRVEPSELQPRLVFYTARDFVNQARRGQTYGELTPTITIVWLVQPLFPTLHRLHSVFELRERTTHHLFSDHVVLHILQLSEISKEVPVVAAPPDAMVQLWARFLAARSAEERYLLAQEDPIMATASETLERISEDPELVRRAEERELSLYFYESSIARAEQRGKQEGLLEGKQEGLLEGKQEGLLEGKQEGLLEGKQEGLLEGKQAGLLEALLALLRTKFGDVPEVVYLKARLGTHGELTRWTERVLSAAQIEDVFVD